MSCSEYVKWTRLVNQMDLAMAQGMPLRGTSVDGTTVTFASIQERTAYYDWLLRKQSAAKTKNGLFQTMDISNSF